MAAQIKRRDQPKIDLIRIGHQIRAGRQRVAMSQSALAERLGLNTMAVSRIERGSSTSLNRLRDLAASLNIPLTVYPPHWKLDSDEARLVRLTAELLNLDEDQRRELLAEVARATGSDAQLDEAAGDE